MASITPAHRSCSATIWASYHVLLFFVLGLTQRTYWTAVFSISSMSWFSCVLNLVETVSAAIVPPLRFFWPSPWGVLALAASTNNCESSVNDEPCAHSFRSDGSVSLLRSSHDVAVYATGPA